MTLGITFRRLQDEALEHFATDEEREAAQKLDTLDRELDRQRNRQEAEKAVLNWFASNRKDEV